MLLDVLAQKCEFKGIGLPDMEMINPHRADLEGAWESMLAHQLPALPPLESFWDALPAFFSWLSSEPTPISPQAYRLGIGESIIRERTLDLPLSRGSQSIIEIIRFAAANRLCVDLDYAPESGARGIRRVEPYSLRRTANGDVVLHIEKPDRSEHRTYRVDRIMNAQASNEIFIPRHEIELSPDKPVHMPASEIRSSGLVSHKPRRRSTKFPARRSRIYQFSTGPTYVYECTACGKKFNRKIYGGSLNPHKDKSSGFPCYGRLGMLVDTKY